METAQLCCSSGYSSDYFESYEQSDSTLSQDGNIENHLRRSAREFACLGDLETREKHFNRETQHLELDAGSSLVDVSENRASCSTSYSLESFESYASSSPRPKLPVALLPGPLLPGPREWPPREPAGTQGAADHASPALEVLLHRADSNRQRQQDEPSRSEGSPALQHLLTALKQRAPMGTGKRHADERSNKRSFGQGAPRIPGSMVDRLRLRSLAADPGREAERGSAAMRALAGLRPPQADPSVAAEAFLRRAVERVTGRWVASQLKGGREPAGHDALLLAGEAAGHFLRAKAERQPQAPPECGRSSLGAQLELWRAAERLRLLRAAEGRSLRPGAEQEGEAAAEEPDRSPCFMPVSARFCRDGAGPAGGEAGEDGEGTPLQREIRRAVAHSRRLHEAAVRALGEAGHSPARAGEGESAPGTPGKAEAEVAPEELLQALLSGSQQLQARAVEVLNPSKSREGNIL
mmetsp:Transcript_24899/g.59244  ORF Transcript_24899/g.59244 Transcript_24899/m.59244 type:complete len:466 (-) Transcript_24899:833-2230(-)